jgi:hypothetical protein
MWMLLHHKLQFITNMKVSKTLYEKTLLNKNCSCYENYVKQRAIGRHVLSSQGKKIPNEVNYPQFPLSRCFHRFYCEHSFVSYKTLFPMVIRKESGTTIIIGVAWPAQGGGRNHTLVFFSSFFY